LYDASAEQYNNVGIMNHSNCKELTLKRKNLKRAFIFYKIQFAEDIPFNLQLSNEYVIFDVATLRPIIKIHPQKYLGPVNQETLENIKKEYRDHRPSFGLDYAIPPSHLSNNGPSMILNFCNNQNLVPMIFDIKNILFGTIYHMNIVLHNTSTRKVVKRKQVTLDRFAAHF
jgi:hypothetical protein